MKKILRHPEVSDNLNTIVKPSELIDIVEMTPLTLADRRIYNLLLGNAWNDMFVKEKHTIRNTKLEQYVNSKNQDTLTSLRRLMSAIVRIRIPKNKNGREAIRQIPLLGVNETETLGIVSYKFSSELIQVIKDSNAFARLSTEVMFKFTSKYALALYEFTEKRKNLKHINYEVLTVEELRKIMGVANGKLKTFGHFNSKALKPALKEISFYSDCQLEAETIRTGKIATHIKLSWKKKDFGGLIGSIEELDRSKIGAKARMNGTVEDVININDNIGKVEQKPKHLTSSTYTEAQAIIEIAGNNWRLVDIEKQFFEYLEEKGEEIRDINQCFLGFVRRKVATLP